MSYSEACEKRDDALFRDAKPRRERHKYAQKSHGCTAMSKQQPLSSIYPRERTRTTCENVSTLKVRAQKNLQIPWRKLRGTTKILHE